MKASNQVLPTLRRLVLCVASAALLVACGGASTMAPPVAPAPEMLGLAMPAVDTLDALTRMDPESERDALLASYIHELRGDPEAAVAALLMEPEWDDAALASMRLHRIYALREHVPGLRDRVAALLDAPPPAHPWGRILHAELGHMIADLAHRRAMVPNVLDGASFGAPTQWRVAGPFSGDDVVDFGRSFEPESDARLAATYDLPGRHIETTQLLVRPGGARAPDGPDGIYYLEAFATVDRDTDALLALSTPARYTVLIDGVPVLERDMSAVYDAQMRATRVHLPAGTHRVLVRLSMSRSIGAVWLRMLTDEPGALLAFSSDPAGPSVGGVRAAPITGVAPSTWFAGLSDDPDTLDWLVRADVATETADTFEAAALVDRSLGAPVHPLRAQRVAAMSRVLFDRRPSERVNLAFDQLGAAEPMWDDASALSLNLAALYLSEGQNDAAEAAIDRAAIRRPDSFAVQLAQADLARTLGWEALWRASAQNAVAAFPGHCETLADLVADDASRGRYLDLSALPEGWGACDGIVERVALTHALRGDAESAIELMQTLVDRAPDRPHGWEVLLDLTLGTGDIERAEAVRAAARAWVYTELDEQTIEVDLRAARGEDVESALQSTLELAPELPGVHALVAFFTGEPAFARLRMDGLAAVREFEDSGATYGGSVVYVLDYAAQSYFEDGSGVEIVHQVTRLQSRDALGEYGETGIPSDAMLLTARTIKADGTTYVPEDIAGKDSISMPNLELGDYIELEYARAFSASDPRSPGARSWRFYFGTLDGAMHRSIARYDVPESWADDVVLDVRAFEGTVDEQAEDGRHTWTYTASAVPPVRPEPRAPNADEWMPSVRLGYGMTWDRVARIYRERVARVTVVTPAIAEAARTLTEGARDTRERARRIFRAINEDVVDFGGFFSEPAGWAWNSHEGERLALTYAMLDAAGLEPEVVFVRPAEQDQTDSPIPDDAVFDLTTIVVRDGRNAYWMEPEFDDVPFDYVRAEAQGQLGFVATGPRAGTFVTTPVWPREVERANLSLTVTFADDGDASIEGRESFPLRTAGSVRMLLSTVEDPAELGRQLEAGLVSSFGRVDLQDYAFTGVEDADGPLRMSYAFGVGAMARATADTIVWDGSIYERPLYAAYGSRDARDHALAITLPMFEQLTVEFVAPEGWVFDAPPSSVDLAHGDSSFSRAFEQLAPDRVRMTRTIELPIQRVEPDAYPAFAEFLREAQSGERVALTMRPR